MQRRLIKLFSVPLSVAFLCFLAPASTGQMLRESVNFVGQSICLQFVQPDNPHSHPEWQDPVVRSTYQIRSGKASHKFAYGVGSIELDEELVQANACSNLASDHIRLSSNGRAAFCLSADKERLVRVSVVATAKDRENLEGIVNSMHSISTCKIGNLGDMYEDGAKFALGRKISIQSH